MARPLTIAAAILAATLWAPALAADAPGKPTKPAATEDTQPPQDADRHTPADAVTHHDVDLNGQHLSYKATAGTKVAGVKGYALVDPREVGGYGRKHLGSV